MSNTGNEKQKRIQHWEKVTALLVLYDCFAVAVAYFAALWLRFDCRYSQIPENYLQLYFYSILPYMALVVIVFLVFRLYRSIWRFAGYVELKRLIFATAISVVLYFGLMYMVTTEVWGYREPISYFLFGAVIQFVLTVGVRFSYRFVLLTRGKRATADTAKRVLVYGAGNAGQDLIRDLRISRESSEKAVCILDDNKNKWGRYIEGVRIYGGRQSIAEACEKYQVQKIYLAIPSASTKDKKEILTLCNQVPGVEIMSLPGMYQLYTGQVSVSKMRKVEIEDLLGREPVKVDMTEISDFLRGKRVLVTGGGGSIGSELCRQIAANAPAQLIIFDVYENNAYDIQLELKRNYPDLQLETIIGSVRDSRKIWQVFEQYRPEVVYHAAAHKHVPLMEDSPCEAIKNNVIGTYKTAFAAMAHGCRRFVLISTDKAVNPTNIMGASKRLCEMVIQAFDRKIKEGRADQIPQLYTHWRTSGDRREEVEEQIRHATTEFVAVRFGNVLGSNGSVIPLFKKQIEAGGPVTVTHPDIIRYFMTIPEAVSLVLQAGVYAKGGEIFVLDMGSPVKIADLARNLIRLSGYEPDVDIDIVFTGLRPGEKLYEEKLMSEEGLKKTDNDIIHIGCPIPFEIDPFLNQLETLMKMAYKNKSNIRGYVQTLVSTYHPAQNS